MTKFLAILGAALSFFISNATAHAGSDYDRLDGTGDSGKKVQVIEWQGNLEIHVYPHGSLQGLALKLDKKNQNKPVMVIGYRFKDNPRKQLVRRAILGIDLHAGFKAYRDPTETEFDKIIVSNDGLSGQVVAFRLDPPPTRLYPNGYPALAQSQNDENRRPARISDDSETGAGQLSQEAPSADPDQDGTIHPFFTNQGSRRLMER